MRTILRTRASLRARGKEPPRHNIMNRFELAENEFDGYVDTRDLDFATAFFVGIATLAFLALVIHSLA